MKEAAEYMKHKGHYGVPPPPEENETRTLEVWPLQKVEEFARENPKKCLIMINEFLVDATAYLGEHVRLHSLSSLFLDTNICGCSLEVLYCSGITRFD